MMKVQIRKPKFYEVKWSEYELQAIKDYERKYMIWRKMTTEIATR